jgi:predicted MPP superfamily phosphohydrolase
MGDKEGREAAAGTDPIAPIEPRRRGRRSQTGFGRVVRLLLLWSVGWWTALGLVVHPWVPGGLPSVLALAALAVLLPLWAFSRAMAGRLYPGAAIRLFVFRPFWYLQLGVPLVAAAGLLGVLAGLPFGSAAAAGRSAAAIMAVLLLAVAVAGWVGSRRLSLRRVEAVFPDLTEGLDGLRIAQLSDLHVGPHTSRRHLGRVVAAVRRADPELVVFTGDQVDDYPRDMEPFARAFEGLRAPLGVFAIAGNHDVYAGWPAVRRGLEAAGHRVLVNEAVELRREGTSVWLAGTGDPAARAFAEGRGAEAAPDVEATLAGIPAGAFVVALAHNPVLWPALAERGVPLTLSGHTHHGQLSIPKLDWSLASIFLEHAMGAYQSESSLLYINPGTNYWGLPFRLGALPEVTLVELRRGAGPVLIDRGVVGRG